MPVFTRRRASFFLYLADWDAKNAGRSDKPHPIEEIPLELFTSVLNVNLVGSFLCTREAFKIFKSQTPTGGKRMRRLRTRLQISD